jgi:DNA-binding NarL/FixJ family response regulator
MSIRIVIADDHALFREGLERLLAATADLDVVASVAGGREALNAALEERPDILLLDISMPDMGGQVVAERLRDVRGAPRVIFLTMHEDAAAFLPSLRQGLVAGYVVKNNAFEELVEAIHTVMAGESYISANTTGTGNTKVQEELTAREREVLRLTAKGLTARSVASELGISVKTVENHRAHILEKLNAANMAEAIAQFARKGLL